MDGLTPHLLYLCGIKHSGKSTLGRRLAEKQNLSFYDSDDLTVAVARAQGVSASTAREVYRALGAEGFKAAEAESLASLVQSPVRSLAPSGGPFSAVVALGGGAADNPRALEAIDGSGYLVYLHVDADDLYERIMLRGRPAFLTSEDPRREFLELYERRDAIYRRVADVTVGLTGCGIDDAAERVEKELRRHSGWK